MLQIATPLPADIPLCATGHRPQLVETRGAPRGRIAGAIVPSHYHIECCQCRLATVPHISRAVAELRWTQPDNPNRIPLHHLPAARAAVHAINAA